ncbi:MAG: hypothetical protein K2Q23_17320 [Bryobacteraceae bacterium]|nr:hypothetical protein [Bryobacteraceae bacterium]
MLIHHPQGNYSFLKGIAPYSAGAVADAGYEIVHVRFRQPVKLNDGFERLRAHLAEGKRPVTALCGMELRSPAPFTFAGFNDFNAGYIGVLKAWGVFVDGVNPIARTNIAPEIAPPREPSLYGFSYTMPSGRREKTFVVAGAGELPEGSLKPEDVIRRGDLSSEGWREKIRYVMGLMSGRIQGLGVSWDLATAIEIYTVHPICAHMANEIVKPARQGAAHGFTWHYARPPIVTIEYEMDLRGCAREILIP